jgi:hypothetical protein
MASATYGREQIFFRILVFFALITAITGIANLTNTNVITLGDLGSGDYMQSIPGQVVPNVQVQKSSSDSGSTVGTQDFTTATGFDHNITLIGQNIFSGDYFSRFDGIGYQSTYVDSLYPNWATMILGGLTPDANGVYDAVYHVNNQFGNYPFYTLVYGSAVGGNSVSGFFIRYDQSSVSIVHSSAIGTPIYSVQYGSANTASTVETVYDSPSGTVNVYVDGNFAASFSNVQYGGVTLTGAGGAPTNSGGVFSGIGADPWGVFYAGVSASHWGLSVSSVDGTFTLPKVGSIWGDILDKINGLVVFAEQVLNLVSAFLGLTSNALVPFWLWAIIGLPCLATLIIIYIQIARGD